MMNWCGRDNWCSPLCPPFMSALRLNWRTLAVKHKRKSIGISLQSKSIFATKTGGRDVCWIRWEQVRMQEWSASLKECQECGASVWASCWDDNINEKIWILICDSFTIYSWAERHIKPSSCRIALWIIYFLYKWVWCVFIINNWSFDAWMNNFFVNEFVHFDLFTGRFY